MTSRAAEIDGALATDGDYVLSDGPARRLEATDHRVLGDLLLCAARARTSPR